MTDKKQFNINRWSKRLLRISLKIFLGFFVITILSVVALKWIDPFTSSIMIQRKIVAMVNFSEKQLIAQHWVNYSEISGEMVVAVIAAEDQKFPFHFGFDLEQIEKAIEDSERGKRLRGASTITQQVAKNLFLWEGGGFIRKGIEAYFTLLIELFLTKERILELYLNIIELGDMVFGVGAASKLYFDEHPKKLNVEQSALLTAVIPNPRRYSVMKPSAYTLKRKNWIMQQMILLGGKNYLKNL
jgi:monofunctional biosynthetic peptidoglycan transglycosylase